MDGLTKTIKAIDHINRQVGLTTAWLTLAMVLLQFVVVVMRYVFSLGSVPAQEWIWYMHGMMFMVGAGYTLLRDGHVRVDIFYREKPPEGKARIDLGGAIFFLIPVAVFLIVSSWDFVVNSWNILEGSAETNGIPAIFWQKSMIMVAAVLLLIQGISMALKAVIVLQGGSPPPAEVPDESHEVIASPRSSCNLVITIAIYLLAIEILTFVIGLGHAGWTYSIVHAAIAAAVIAVALTGTNRGRIVAATGLFVLSCATIGNAFVASGDPGAFLTLLGFAIAVGAFALSITPFAPFTREDRSTSPMASPGFAIVVAIALYAVVTEAIWFIDVILGTIKTISFEHMPRFVVPAVMRVLVVTMVAAFFYRGSPVARWLLAALFVVGTIGSGLQLGGGTASVADSMTRAGNIVIAVFHLAVAALLVFRPGAILRFQADQRASYAALEPDPTEG